MGAASSPFNMPVSPVAGFNPYQQQYFGGIQGMQGMAQPYMQAGAGYLGQSAAPVSGQDVANYYNPMASNVFGQMQNIFGQQQQATTGQLTQAAGGVGADRIAVGQSELANQQGLAAGQTAAGLYQQALSGAQQQKQMEAGAGYGLSQLGPAAQAAQLQSLGALGQAGGQQQQLTQQQMNAQYQNQLAQIAWPYQNNQYLASIAGGLGPAMGGTTQGQSTTTGPTPSPLNQALGVGTSLLGMGMKGKGSGGRVGYAEGGAAYGKLADNAYRRDMAAMVPSAEAGNPFSNEAYQDIGGSLPMFADGGDTEQAPPFPGLSLPGGSGFGPIPLPGATIPHTPGSNPIPYISMGQGSGQFHNNLDLRHAKTAQNPETVGGDVSQALKLAQGAGDMLSGDGGFSDGNMGGTSGNMEGIYASGGLVNPYHVGQGFAGGGDTDSQDNPITDDFDQHLSLDNVQGEAGRFYGKNSYDPSGEDQYGKSGPAGPVAQALKERWNNAGSPLSDRLAGPPAAKANIAPTQVSPPAPAQAASPMGDVPMPQGRPREASLVDPSAPISDVYRAGHETLSKSYGPVVASAVMGNLGVESPSLNPTESHDQGTGIGIAGWRNERRTQLYDFAKQQGLDPSSRQTQFAFLQHDLENNYPDLLKRMQATNDPVAAARMFRTEYERPAGTTQGNPMGLGRASRLASNFNSGNFDVGDVSSRGHDDSTPSSPLNANMKAENYTNGRKPYPDATDRDWGQRAARSPWMSLVKAGAAMASTTGPIGTAIGRGISAGAGSLDSQRGALRSEEQINQKAQGLYQQAQEHLDRYQRKTPHELAIEQQGRFQVINYTDPASGQIKVGRFDARHGAMTDSQGNPVEAGRVLGRNAPTGMNQNQALTQARNLVSIPGSKYWGKDPMVVAQEIMGSHTSAQPAPSEQDIAWIKAHPEDKEKFKTRFGVDPP